MIYREKYLEKFHELKLDNIKVGLGIGTRIGIDIDHQYKKPGSIHVDTNAELIGEVHLDDLDPILRGKIQHIIDNPVLENKLDHLHAAMRDIKILIIDNTNHKKTIHINRKISGNQYTHLIVYVRENIMPTLFIKTEALNNLSLATEFLDIIIEDGSTLNIVDIRNYGNEYFIYSRKNAHLHNNSNILWTNIEGPAKLNITSLSSMLNGHNASSKMNNLVLSRNSEYNMFTKTAHNKESGESMMHSRVIMNRSKAIMRGVVYIDKDAYKSNGYQKTDMMMLDEESQAISIPDLEIHNNDVKCTHGSTISRPDDEKIFYLKSRGLNDADAEMLLIQGFYEKMIEHVPEKLRDDVRKKIEEMLYLQE